MTPTETEKRKAAALIFTAAAERKTCQSLNVITREWYDLDPFGHPRDVTSYPHNWRVKPQPVVRPWSKPDDVPGPVCWIRNPAVPDEAHIISYVGSEYFGYGRIGDYLKLSWRDTRIAALEYSTDRQNWKKCEVEEAA